MQDAKITENNKCELLETENQIQLWILGRIENTFYSMWLTINYFAKKNGKNLSLCKAGLDKPKADL